MSSGAPFKTRTYKRSPFEREKLKGFSNGGISLTDLAGRLGERPISQSKSRMFDPAVPSESVSRWETGWFSTRKPLLE
jgi:hypothetical protein